MNAAIFPACDVKDNYLYCVTLKEHILEKIDLATYEIEYLDGMDGYSIQERKTVDLVRINGDYIYLFEYDGMRIIQVQPESGRTNIIHVCEEENGGYASVEFYKNKMYLFPQLKNQIIVINLETGEKSCFYYDAGQADTKWKLGEHELDKRICSAAYMQEENIYLFSEINNKAVKYSIADGKIEYIPLPYVENGCISVQRKEDACYLLDGSGRICAADKNLGGGSVIIDTEKECPYFGEFVIAGNFVWMLPWFGNEIRICNRKETKVYTDYPEDFRYFKAKTHSQFYRYCEDDKNYYFAMHAANYLLIISKESSEGQWMKLKENCQTYLKYLGGMVRESRFGLDDFLENLQRKDIETNNKNCVGKSIWKEVSGK